MYTGGPPGAAPLRNVPVGRVLILINSITIRVCDIITICERGRENSCDQAQVIEERVEKEL